MPDVLRLDVDGAARHTLPGPVATFDPATAAVVEAAVAEAADAAYREGEAAGLAVGQQHARTALAGLEAALAAVQAELVAQRELMTRHHLDVADALASAVLGATPPTEARTLLDIVAATIAALDAPALTVRVHAADHELIAGADLPAHVTVDVDPGIARGEARIVGADGGAELTRRALLDAALEALQAGTLDEVLPDDASPVRSMPVSDDTGEVAS